MSNDIASEVDSNSNILLFADDAKIFSEANFVLQKSLHKIYYRLKKRKLNLNPSKCHVLNIHRSTSITTFFFLNKQCSLT